MSTIFLMIAFLAGGHIVTNAEKLDVAIFVDASSTICAAQPCPNWIYLLQFVRDIVESLTIGPGNTRVSLVIVSDQARVVWDFNRYTDKDSLLLAIRDLEFPGGELTKQITLDFVLHDVFSKAAGDRPDVHTVGIGITDGTPRTNVNLGFIAATALQATGVEVIMICVSPRCPESLARGLSSPPKKSGGTYFMVKDFSDLGSVKENLVKQLLAS